MQHQRETSKTLTSPLARGSCFVIKGTTAMHCERFSINLMCNQDVAIHINPRLPQNYIVRNCYVNGDWGQEEVNSTSPFTLRRGTKFTIQVLATEDDFYVAVNGAHHSCFRHRLPYARVNRIEVKGDLRGDVQIDECIVDSYPNVQPELVNLDAVANCETVENAKIVNPVYKQLESPFNVGKKLTIVGRLKLLPHSFVVNLQNGSNIWPHPAIPFHFNPRFAGTGGKHIICKNTWANGAWMKEERDHTTLFVPGKMFELEIQCTDFSYNVFLNGIFFTEYAHRNNVTRPVVIDTVSISGDIVVKSIQFQSGQCDPIDSYIEY